jgi:hypothetical protein
MSAFFKLKNRLTAITVATLTEWELEAQQRWADAPSGF